MKRLFGIITAVFTLLLMAVTLYSPQPVKAAEVRTGENLVLSSNQKNLKDLYLFGNTIDLSAPVTNDVVTAGNTINLNSDISNSVIAAGNTVTIRGKVGNTIRTAGGTVTIDGPVTNDLVVAGGTVIISRNATIGGDLMVAGGQVTVDGPVHGNILMTGGTVTLDSTVGGNVNGSEVSTLTLGSQAHINGNLSYSSSQQAKQEPGSSVKGKIDFHRVEKTAKEKQQAAQAAITAAIGKLVLDIILSLLLIYFFRNGLLTIIAQMQKAPWKSLGIGFAYLILAPIASLILLILLWLGIASFLFYALLLIISTYLANVFVGWWIMRWWDTREKRVYMLDWKAGVIGPIVLFIIGLIPILGWLIDAIIFLIALGAFLRELVTVMPRLQEIPKKK